MTYNEFQRELRSRGVEEPYAYVFTLIYERLIETANQVDGNSKALLALAHTVQHFVSLHEVTQNRMMELVRQRDANVESEGYEKS